MIVNVPGYMGGCEDCGGEDEGEEDVKERGHDWWRIYKRLTG